MRGADTRPSLGETARHQGRRAHKRYLLSGETQQIRGRQVLPAPHGSGAGPRLNPKMCSRGWRMETRALSSKAGVSFSLTLVRRKR